MSSQQSTSDCASVMDGRHVRIGDRVRHFGQRYNHLEGTATVVGWYAPGSDFPAGWTKIIVEPDVEGDVYGTDWDYDRTVKVNALGSLQASEEEK